jgi:hypothetical protein
MPPAFDGRLANRAYVVLPNLKPAERLIIVVRGETGFYISTREGIANLKLRELRALAARLNWQDGVSSAAAGALDLDWACGYKAAPIEPAEFAAYRRDRSTVKMAKRGKRVARAASSAYPEWIPAHDVAARRPRGALPCRLAAAANCVRLHSEA